MRYAVHVCVQNEHQGENEGFLRLIPNVFTAQTQIPEGEMGKQENECRK